MASAGHAYHTTDARLARGLRKLIRNLFRERADTLPVPRVRTIIHCKTSVFSLCPTGHDREATAEVLQWSDKSLVEKKQK